MRGAEGRVERVNGTEEGKGESGGVHGIGEEMSTAKTEVFSHPKLFTYCKAS